MKVIKTNEEYTLALKDIEALIDKDPLPGTEDADKLELLTLLVKKYESETFNITKPTAIEALKFRMEQQNLTQKDLIPYIGNRSKVSEILSGKRELSLPMIRALHKHLGIPADILLEEKPNNLIEEHEEIDFSKIPVMEMAKNNAFTGLDISRIRDNYEELVRILITNIGGFKAIPSGLFRTTNSARLNAKIDSYAIFGWSLQVLSKAVTNNDLSVKFSASKLTKPFLQSLVGLSIMDNGPKLAKDYLEKAGIILEIVPHLKNTYVDGAAFITHDNKAIIGMSLRYDRIDNFWFTLLHELGHIKKHLKKGNFIIDDMSLEGSGSDNDLEKEADKFALDMLFPKQIPFINSDNITKDEIYAFAEKNNIHPAIIAGRIQFAKGDYRTFSNLVGRGEVRKCFK